MDHAVGRIIFLVCFGIPICRPLAALFAPRRVLHPAPWRIWAWSMLVSGLFFLFFLFFFSFLFPFLSFVLVFFRFFFFV
jgi:hypothetical protein